MTEHPKNRPEDSTRVDPSTAVSVALNIERAANNTYIYAEDMADVSLPNLKKFLDDGWELLPDIEHNHTQYNNN